MRSNESFQAIPCGERETGTGNGLRAAFIFLRGQSTSRDREGMNRSLFMSLNNDRE